MTERHMENFRNIARFAELQNGGRRALAQLTELAVDNVHAANALACLKAAIGPLPDTAIAVIAELCQQLDQTQRYAAKLINLQPNPGVIIIGRQEAKGG